LLRLAGRHGGESATQSQNNMTNQDDLSDIDPKIVESVLANADAYVEVQRRIELILKKADNEVEKTERIIGREEGAGDEAVQNYQNALQQIDAHVRAALGELESEFQQRYPATE